MKKTCPDCEALISPQGLKAHMDGAPCTAATAQLQAKRSGLVRAYKTARFLQSHTEVEVSYLYSGLIPGGIGRRTQLVRQPWAPAGAVKLAEELSHIRDCERRAVVFAQRVSETLSRLAVPPDYAPDSNLPEYYHA